MDRLMEQCGADRFCGCVDAALMQERAEHRREDYRRENNREEYNSDVSYRVQ